MIAAACRVPRVCTQSGVALITVLLVVALATVLAVAMTSRQQLDIRRSANLFEADQALAYVGGAEDWAVHFLAALPPASVAQRATPPASTVDTGPWALPPMPVDGGTISASLVDAQGRLDLNVVLGGTAPAVAANASSGSTVPQNTAAMGTAQQTRLRRLLRGQGVSANRIDAMVAGLLDWIDADSTPRFPDGAEDDAYLRASPAYRAANQPLADASEVLRVHGWRSADWQRIAPYVTALPVPAGLNINTASAPVLQSLAPGLDKAAAQALIALRGKGFASLAAFRRALQQVAPQAAAVVQTAGLSVTSRFYVLHTRIRVGRIEQAWRSVIERDGLHHARIIARQLSGF